MDSRKRYAKANPDRVRLWNRVATRKYRLKLLGMTLKEFERILREQDFRCAICQCTDPSGRGQGNWVMDHNHETGQNRGVLCHNCNVSLGLLGENEITLLRMIRYLRRYPNGVQTSVNSLK